MQIHFCQNSGNSSRISMGETQGITHLSPSTPRQFSNMAHCLSCHTVQTGLCKFFHWCVKIYKFSDLLPPKIRHFGGLTPDRL